MNKTESNLSVAVIGCGYWGKNLVRDFHSLGALAAVSDSRADTAETMAAYYKVPAREVDEILADKTIDGVVIAAPAEYHAALALKSFAVGKHVYVEKPISLSIEDAKRMIEASQKAGRILMVGHLLQYHPVFMKLKEMVAGGALGKLRYIYSRRLSLGKLRTAENVLWSFAPHDISMILTLAGEEPSEVHGIAASYLQDKISDFASVHICFPNGVRAHVETSWLNPFKEQRLVVVGDKGMAEFCDSEPEWKNKLKLYRHEAYIRDGIPSVKKAEPELIEVEPDNPLLNECRHFLHFMATNKTPFTDGHEALAVLKVLRAGDATQRTEKIK
jgi:UDP-2-acetamido-3-amino-2,3-dideoxy-glucuronate N-acetyltransferase